MTNRVFSDEDRYKLGNLLGDSIDRQIRVIAMLEGIQPWEVLEEMLAAYVSQRVIDEAQSGGET